MDKSEGGIAGTAMKLEVLELLIDKAIREINNIEFVALYNWTEPLLHPKLPEIVSIIKSRNIPVHLSSNLNILKNPDELMLSNPDYFRVSVSGFEQAGYSMTHRGGDISIVKENMIALMESHHKVKAETNMTVLFHKYIGNKGDEEKMKVFSESLGYSFESVWAALMPMEKAMAYAGVEEPGTTLNDQDWEIIDHLALPLAESIIQARTEVSTSCWLKERQMVFNPEGEVVLCCTVYDQEKHNLGNFLDISAQKVELLKNGEKSMQTCTKCMGAGLHSIAVYGVKELDELAYKNLQIFS